MNDSPLLFIVAGAIIAFLGARGLYEKEVYLGRLIRFIGPKLVLRSRPGVLVYGVLLCAGGVVSILVGIAALIDPQTALVDQIMPIAIVAFLAGFFGSMVVELIIYSSNLPPYDDVDPADHADNYRDSYR